MNFDTLAIILKYLELDESRGLRRLVLGNCGLSGDMATALLCRMGGGRDISLILNENPLETGSVDWIDLIEGNEAPRTLHLDMIQLERQRNFHRLITALTQNKTIEFLSLVGTGPPTGANAEMSEVLFNLFKLNDSLKFLDISGYSGKLEESQMGWSLSGALSGLMQNSTLLQLRIRNHDLGAAEDVTELCRVLAINQGLAMLDCQNNNFNHSQFAKLVHALDQNQRLISFPWSSADRDYALQEQRRQFMKSLSVSGKPLSATLSKSAEHRLDGLLKSLKEKWNAEAKKAEEIIRRNRDNLSNNALEFESEYVDAWEDKSLAPWLAPSPNISNDSGGSSGGGDGRRSRLSVGSLVDARSRGPSPSPTPCPVLPTVNFEDAPAAPHNASEPALGLGLGLGVGTYTIEEESTSSNRTSLYQMKTHHSNSTTLLHQPHRRYHDGGSTTSLASSLGGISTSGIISPHQSHRQQSSLPPPPEVDSLTLDNW